MRIVVLALLAAGCSGSADQRDPAVPGRGETPPAPSRPAPVVTPRADDPAGVAHRYWTLAETKRAIEARALWIDPVAADAFARRLSVYPAFDARVEGVGATEAGAGQHYVTVRFSFSARRAEGGIAREQGAMTLRRTVVDGADAAARRWRIDTIDLPVGEPPRD